MPVIFTPCTIPGTWVIDVERNEDERGFFARAWCSREFLTHGLSGELVQGSIAYSHYAGTLRGLHFQVGDNWEEKLVRCTRGAALVVAVDLRRASATCLKWCAVELTADNRRQFYVPQGCAQGYQTLEDQTEVVYQMSHPYVPDAAAGVRYNDPVFGIQWPRRVTKISVKDLNWPDYVG